MKKVLFTISLLMICFCFTFAQEKSVKQAKKLADAGNDLGQAEKLINEALTNDETKNQANTWYVAGYIQKKISDKEAEKAYLKQVFDTAKMYSSIYNMFEFYFKCDELEQVPDEKGRLKIKFREANAKTLKDDRPILINGGVKYYNENKNQEALKYFSMYIDSADKPIFQDPTMVANDSLIPQIAYYASLASMKLEDYKNVLKYTPLTLQDQEVARYGYEFSASAYKALGDTVKWVETLKEGVMKYPTHMYFFGNLIEYYSSAGKYDEASEFVNNMVAQNPSDSFFQYVKGYICQNLKDYDNAIVAYKAAIELNPSYSEAYSNLGLIYCQLARDFGENVSSDLNSAQYKADQEKIKSYYQEAKPYYEKARELKPENKEMWINGLYSIYYMLNMGTELEEIEKLMDKE